MRMSLRARLILSFLVIILATSAAFVLLSNRLIISRFTSLVARSGQNFARRVAPVLEDYYRTQGSWEGVDSLASSLLLFRDIQGHEFRPPIDVPLPNIFVVGNNERILLMDNDEILLDTQPDSPQPIDRGLIQEFGVPLTVDDKQVGIVAVTSTFGIFNELQAKFVEEVNRTLLVAALFAIAAVVAIGIIQSQSILKPVQQLADAALKVAKGDYSQRVKVNRKDELGDMAEAFNSMAGDLALQQELRRKSMADIAHELRTPLSIIQIDLESLEDGLMEFTPDNIRLIRNEAAHLNAMVEDLRLLSQADAGELRIELTKVEIGSIVREIIERQWNLMREKQLTLDYQLPDNEVFIMGDTQRLSQILINLINNAVQHTAAGGKIVINAEQNGNFVDISVQDNGEGIPAEDLPYVFERLYRVEKSRSRDEGGTGLGLSIARSLVEAQGGTISVESAEGYGSTFKIRLPLAI